MENSSSITYNYREHPTCKYNYLKNPNDSNSITCRFYKKAIKSGIYRAKQQQVGNFKNIKVCFKCPLKIKKELCNQIIDKKATKVASESYGSLLELGDEPLRDDAEEDNVA